MTSKTVVLVIAAAVLGGGPHLRAQTASELLQKGIYLQETIGDLDGAIKAYRQVFQMAQGSRPSAAQALYRLGVCLGKKNQEAEAAQIFQKVIDEYPDQADVVEKARALLPSGLKLLPAPWVDGEILDLVGTVGAAPSGAVKMRYSFRSSKTTPSNWDLETRMYNPASMFVMRVEADRENMKPVFSASTNPMFSGHIKYEGPEVSIQFNGKEPVAVKVDGAVFDANELVAVLRRLPLSVGYKTSLRVLGSVSAEVQKNSVVVTGEEDVKTSAGQFHAYRVEVKPAIYWISTDPSHYPVKFEQGAVISFELVAIRRDDQPSIYRNDQSGFSLNVPAGWTIEESGMVGMLPGNKRMVQLVDSASSALVTLTVEPRGMKTAPTAEGMRSEALGSGSHASFPPQKMRTDSLQGRQVGGNPALSWMADATGLMDKSPLIAYTVWVRNTPWKAEFSARADPQEFAALQPRLDEIIDSLTLAAAAISLPDPIAAKSNPSANVPGPASTTRPGGGRDGESPAGVSAPEVIFKKDPEYTEEARRAKHEGSVLLAILVSPDGKATNIRVVRSLGMGLDEKAMEAVKQWIFKPGYVKGRPVTVQATIEVNFRLLHDRN